MSVTAFNEKEILDLHYQKRFLCNLKIVNSYLELLSDAEDLVDEVLNTDDVLFAELLLNDCVGGDGHTLAVHLGETALVYQLRNK